MRIIFSTSSAPLEHFGFLAFWHFALFLRYVYLKINIFQRFCSHFKGIFKKADISRIVSCFIR
jgi:hypothetical protein